MRYKAIVSYDGFAYGGWQKQEQGTSIQEEIEKALAHIHQKEITICASGRTDAQVHAKGQVFHFDSDRVLDDYHFTKAINALLPKDIRIQHVEHVDDEFHARFHAVAKRYEFLVTNDIGNPFFERYMAKEWKPLDFEAMCSCVPIFLGEHNFTSFTSSKIDPRKPRVKTIYRLDVIQEAGYIRIRIIGSGFLRYMVRMIAQTIIEVGKHRITFDDVKVMLEAEDKHSCRFKADPQGLYLMEVYYTKEAVDVACKP